VLALVDVNEGLVNDEAMENEDPMRFREARDGDHLMCPFQCDDCVFVNLRKRKAMDDDIRDLLTIICIRRIILDGFWARERSTVDANRRQGLKWLAICDKVGEEDPYPERGPYGQEDTFGMKVAIGMLVRSLDPGKNTPRLQYETTRKLRGHFSNFVHTTPNGMGATFIGDEGGASTITNSPTNSMWFRRFMTGCHRRMGDVWIPDRAITIQEVKACFALLDEDWKVFGKDIQGQRQTCLTAVTLIGGFFAALRGEEIVRMDVGSMRENWKEAMGYPEAAHVPVMLAGRFKKEIGEKLFCQPLALVSGSGIEIGTWFYRTLWVFARLGVISGPLFRVGGKDHGKFKRASCGDLDPGFHEILKRVRKIHSRLIGEKTNIVEEYSVYRSLRRGATAHAQNVEMPKEVIEANNRWRKHLRARGLTPGMSMMERYSDAKASVPALIRFSRLM
jgi:hypothetical protein